MNKPWLDFNRPLYLGNEFKYMKDAILRKKSIAGNGHYSRLCAQKITSLFSCRETFMTPSGTAALEMASILLDLRPGDEIIVPSFTFVTTVGAFYLRGVKPVFVDIRPDTLNMDERLIEKAISKRTKAIVVVHYGSIACEMDEITRIARKYRLHVVEDAAHCFGATYKGQPLGSLGNLSILSFHETKNIHCGEGGALLVNDRRFLSRAYAVYEKGTNRKRFMEGHVQKYTWVEPGSSFAMSDLNAAFLYGHLMKSKQVIAKRMKLVEKYHELLQAKTSERGLKLPFYPNWSAGNGHLFYILCRDAETRTALLNHCLTRGVQAVFHYVPLHKSPMAVRHGWDQRNLPTTEKIAQTLIRLPLFYQMTFIDVRRVVKVVENFFEKN